MMHSLPTRIMTSLRPAARAHLRGLGCSVLACLALPLATVSSPVLYAQTQQTSLPVIVADFNHDGIPDVLVPAPTTSPTSQTIPPAATIAFGSVPYGTFIGAKGVNFPSSCVSFTIPSAKLDQLLVGDFNGDGFPDIYFNCATNANQTAYMSGVMLGNGDGTFGTAVTLSTATGSGAVLGDFNHDGKLDIVFIQQVPDTSSSQISFYSGNGDGTFATPVNTVIGISSSVTLESLIAADVDGDGYPDLVAVSLSNSSANIALSVFGNNKNGSFGTVTQGTGAPSTSVTLGVSPAVSAFSVRMANVFGTGKPDFVIADSGSTPGIFVVKNTSSTASFSLANPVKTPYAATVFAQVGNFSGTAFSDIAVWNGTTVGILVNDGTGNYTANYSTLTLSSLPATSYGPPFAVADSNADGYADLYTAATSASGTLQLSVSLVSGTATATSQPFSLGLGTKAISAAWPGNIDFTGSTATGTQIVNGVASTAAVISSKNPSLLGDAVTFTVAVASGVTSSVIPTGSLILQDNGATLTSGTLDQTGKLTYTTSALTQGLHAITAVYAGDTYFAGITSPVLSQVVNHSAAVSPILTWPTPAPITYGTPLSAAQLNATAADANGLAVPGTFAYTPAAGTILNAGLQTLKVLFTPTDTASFLVATKSVQLNVLQAAPAVTLTLSSGGNSTTTVAAGTAIKLIAAVSSAGTPVKVGQVNFCDAAAAYCTDVHLLGTAQLTTAGTASINLVPSIGVHSYKAVFLGTANTAASASTPSALTVTGRYATTTTIAQTGTVGNYTLTATTIGVGSAVIAPTGVVSFLDQSNSNASLASVPLGSSAYLLQLGPPSSTPTGREPGFIATGDFNGDGKPDLAVINQGTPGLPSSGQTISILLGNGNGSFTAAPSPATGNGPIAVVVADFNGDGFSDLAVTNSGDNTVSLLFGNGDGTFKPATTVATGAGPNGIATADFNGDGIADLIVANGTANTLTVLLGNGDGTFTASATAPATGTGPQSIVVADFNADGKADVAVANIGATGLTVLLGNGDGTFTPGGGSGSAQVSGGTLPQVYTGDFNGDGKPDLVVASQNDNTLNGYILLGQGDGTFTNSSGLGADPTYSFALAVRDIDGDGNSDIVVVDNNGTTILHSNGDGTFAPIANVQAGNDASTESAVIADFNGDGVPDIASANSDADAVVTLLTQLTQTATAVATGVSPLGPGTHAVIASYVGDTAYAPSTSATTSLTGSQVAPVLTWTPAVASIVYGTPLGPQQLNAVVTGPNGVAVNGVFTYLPAAGTVLTVGQQNLTVNFTPSDPTFIPVSGTATITVTQATPVLTWATPASIAYGIPLSGSQLNAIVTGVTGTAPLPGVFTYTPAAGTILTPGTQTLNVRFVPTDVTDYTAVAGSVKLLVTGITLTSITPSAAILGDGDKTVTLIGSGFVATSVVQVNGTAVATTLVNPTTLTAIIPAANFARVGSLQVTVLDPTISLTSSPLTVMVAASSPSVTLGGPPTTAPGSQPSLSFSINNPYPVALTAVFTLTFAPSVTPAVDDPAIQFANGSRIYTFVIPANSTAVPPILLQSGTVAGAITISLGLTAGGTNVTPTTLQPVVIAIPAAVPTVSTTTLIRNGSQLSVAIHGFSNTREVTQATFHFVGIGGAQIDTPDITAPVGTLFTGWFGSTQSALYGSTFTYTQVFNVSDNAANIGSVQVTLTNSVGVSTSQTAQ